MGTTTQLIVLKQLSGNSPMVLSDFQKFLLPHTDTIVALWFSLWCMTALVLLVQLLRAYLKHKK